MKRVFYNYKLKCVVHQRLEKINRVIISVGHDPISVGAKNEKGENENAICKTIAVMLADILQSNGFVVWLMPDYTLQNTIRYLNTQGNSFTDFAIEIHKDSWGDYDDNDMRRRVGLYYAKDSAGALTIAATMVKTMQEAGAHQTSWIRPDTDSNHGSLGFCSKTKMLGMVAEMGFIQGENTTEENQWYANALANAIIQVLKSR